MRRFIKIVAIGAAGAAVGALTVLLCLSLGAKGDSAPAILSIVSGLPEQNTAFMGQEHRFEETASGLLEYQETRILVWEGECVEGQGWGCAPKYLRLVLMMPYCKPPDVGRQRYEATVQGWVFDIGPECRLHCLGQATVTRDGRGVEKISFVGAGQPEGCHAPYWEMSPLGEGRMAWIREEKPERLSDLEMSGDLRSAQLRLKILLRAGLRSKRFVESHGGTIAPYVVQPNASSEDVARDILRTNALTIEEGCLRLIEVPESAAAK